MNTACHNIYIYRLLHYPMTKIDTVSTARLSEEHWTKPTQPALVSRPFLQQ